MRIAVQLKSRTQARGTNSNLMLHQQTHTTIVTSYYRQNRTRKSNQIFGTSISMSLLLQSFFPYQCLPTIIEKLDFTISESSEQTRLI